MQDLAPPNPSTTGTWDWDPQPLLFVTEEFVRHALSQHDSSHDFHHINRVRAAASRIAAEEGLTPQRIHFVELCALLHDVEDWKYQGTAKQASVAGFLQQQGCSQQAVDEVLGVINSIGFKEELAASSSGAQAPTMSLEAKCLQDADRLDAIGAVGVARCLTFGGAFKRVLHDPSVPPRVGLTKEQYMNEVGEKQNTTINHFYEKLLLLKDKMKTETGRRMAQQRHDFMVEFLEQFHAEWHGSR